jgi:hypothetical protein
MTLDHLFNQLLSLAEANDFAIYNICFRNAGVAVQWCDLGKLRKIGTDRYSETLMIDHYHPDLRKAIQAEIKRFKSKKRDLARAL